MQIKILHLYYDLMNLYGENGNIRVLKRHLEDQGASVIVDEKTISDDIDFSLYDFIYSGSGTNSNQRFALEHLKGLEHSFKESVDKGTVILFTGNSFEMLAKSITYFDNEKVDGLAISSFYVMQQNKKRYTSDIIAKFNEINSNLVGYINRCSEIFSVKTPLFEIQMGLGNSNSEKIEGFRERNLFATHITGPILVKNPEFMKFIVRLILSRLDTFEYKNIEYLYEKKSFDVTLKELKDRIESAKS